MCNRPLTSCSACKNAACCVPPALLFLPCAPRPFSYPPNCLALLARQGNVSVEKDVLYADRAKYFPWRPRLWMAAYDILLYSALAQALMLAWALLSPVTAGTQPVIWCEWGAAKWPALEC